MRKQFAVFDIDGTIARTSLLQLMIRELTAREKVSVGTGHRIEMMLHDYRQRIDDSSFGAYMKQAVDMIFSELPQGLRIEDYNEIIDSIVKTSLTHTYVYTRELVQTLKENNFFLIAISGSELHAVGALAEALGFDAWAGQVIYDQKDGRLTGAVKTLDRPKTDVLQSIIYKYKLKSAGSLAVGDTSSDIDILESVDIPIVFNPNQALFNVAKSNGWMIILERKDMIYRLELSEGQYVLKQTNF